MFTVPLPIATLEEKMLLSGNLYAYRKGLSTVATANVFTD